MYTPIVIERSTLKQETKSWMKKNNEYIGVKKRLSHKSSRENKLKKSLQNCNFEGNKLNGMSWKEYTLGQGILKVLRGEQKKYLHCGHESHYHSSRY